MKRKRDVRDNSIRLVFNGPVHQVNVYNNTEGDSSVAPPEAAHQTTPPIAGLEATLFSITRPQEDSHYETKPDGTICATGEDYESDQLRAHVFGDRNPGEPPTPAQIEAAFPTATTIPHDPDFDPHWIFPALGGATFTKGKVNYLVVWQVFDLYTLRRRHHKVEFTAKHSYETWCEIYMHGASPPSALATSSHSDHPDLYQIAPVSCGSHGASSSGCDLSSALEGANILVREPESHEDYPAWRSCSYGKTKGDWVLHQCIAPDGNWEAVLRFIPEQTDDSQSPKVWASTSSWNNRLGGIMVGAGLPELEVRNAG